MHEHVHVEAEFDIRCFPLSLHLFYFEAESLTEPGVYLLTRLVSQEDPVISHLCPLPMPSLQGHEAMLGFLWGHRRSRLVSHAYKSAVLPNERSLWSPTVF